MTMKPIHWSDEDRYFGPFTFAKQGKHYRSWAIVLGSGDGDDYPGCRLRVSGFGCTLIVALPAIIKPYRTKVYAQSWDAATVERLGRDWYWDEDEREYGFSYSDGFLRVFLGRQTNDSSTEKSWSKHLPWTQWRHVRHSFYDLSGDLFGHLPNKPSYRVWHNRWDLERAIEAACPAASFDFDDFDGERINATTKIEEREWRFGEGWSKWLSLFRRPKVSRSLSISFSAETGDRKGSWKGGTMGTGIEMLPGELHEAAFRRYCAEHAMTFVGIAA